MARPTTLRNDALHKEFTEYWPDGQNSLRCIGQDAGEGKVKLYHGVRDGRLIDVAEVERGLACGCACAQCSRPLIAKKGQQRRHHFAHEGGAECAWSVETTLHRAAKEILESAGRIWIPAIDLTLLNKTRRLKEARHIPVSRVTLESRQERFVPDVTVESEGAQLLIEIKVTHGVDEAKLEKIRGKGVSALEIDLSRTARKTTLTELTPLIIDRSEGKHWLHSELAARTRSKLRTEAVKFPETSRGLAIHIDGCPIAARRWHGKPYANVIDDCCYCEHSVDREEPYLYCMAPRVPPGQIPKAEREWRERTKEAESEKARQA